VKWAYGITTVPERRTELFERTLASLKQAGFSEPRLFVDNCQTPEPYFQYGLEVTCRWPRIKTFGNWMLSLWELYIREPTADRYAIFQDDFVTYKNLRGYLEATGYPIKGYTNLYSFPSNERLVPEEKIGWYKSNQLGRGAVALVFDQETTKLLLYSKSLALKPQDTARGTKSVDGAVQHALSMAGVIEYVHNPSLVQHTGYASSMGNNVHPLSKRFRGEEFDARDFLVSKEQQS